MLMVLLVLFKDVVACYVVASKAKNRKFCTAVLCCVEVLCNKAGRQVMQRRHASPKAADKCLKIAAESDSGEQLEGC